MSIRFPSVDSNNNLPAAVRARLAANLVDPATVEGAALDATYVTAGPGGLFIDVTRGPYNAAGDGVTDDFDAINDAAAAVEAAGGGTVFLPRGTYRIGAHLLPRAHVRYLGAGMGVTVIAPYQSAAFTGHGTLAEPIESPSWQDMTWDGSAIPEANSLKGQFSEYLRRALWLRVECKDFTATGFGSDYLPGGRYIDCIANGNGRGQAIDGPGMSGFGIGTGKYEVEDCLVQGCVAVGNTNYGIFVERQPSVGAYNSYGVRVIGNYVEGNGYGIGGCGVDGAVYASNVVRSSVRDGITLHAGSGTSPLGMPDKRATITGNTVLGSGRDGIHLDYGTNSIPANQARHVITGNAVHGSVRDGLRIIGTKWTSDVLRGIKVAGNKFALNGGAGVNVVTATDAEAGAYIADLNIEGNDVHGNGLSAIRLAAPLTRPVVRGNKCYDDQHIRTQDYGIETVTGFTLTDAVVVDNVLYQNQTAAALFSATWAGDSVVAGNRGYAPGWASIPIGPSPIAYTCGVTPETVYLAGGMTSSIKVTPKGSSQATVILAAGTATLPLMPGDAIEIAYTGAPTSLKAIKGQ